MTNYFKVTTTDTSTWAFTLNAMFVLELSMEHLQLLRSNGINDLGYCVHLGMIGSGYLRKYHSFKSKHFLLLSLLY